MVALVVENRYLHHGANLAWLKSLPTGSIDLIYTDPPYNTGKDWKAYSDKWTWDTNRLADISAARLVNLAKDVSGDDTAAFLVFLGERLQECYRILRPTGSLYLHCDWRANSYIRLLLDAIFGRAGYRNEITVTKPP